MKNIRKQWKAHASAQKISSRDIAALCIYRSLLKHGNETLPQGYGKEGAIQRLRKSFKPITNTVKLENGCTPFCTLVESLRLIKYSEVYSWLDEADQKDMLALASELAKEKF